MKLWLAVLHIILVGTNIWVTANFHEDPLDDSDFAEFENFDDEVPVTEEPNIHLPIKNNKQEDKKNVKHTIDFEEDDIVVEEDSDFDHFEDEEEFEGLEHVKSNTKNEKPSTLTIAKVPLHLRARWDSYYLEIIMIFGLLMYFTNYAAGKSKNYRMAEAWFNNQEKILLENFSLVGDNGKSQEEESSSLVPHGLIKESESHYAIYCSGRMGCEAMLIELKLLKRQDLVAVLAQLVRPQNDQIHIRIDLNKDTSDNFVFAAASKRTAIHLVKDMADVSIYCPERKVGDKFGLPSSFFVMAEISETIPVILNSKILSIFNKYEHHIDYIHISDQYSGPKQQEETNQLTMPEVKRVLLVGLNFTIKGRITADSHNKMRALLELTFYLLDKLQRFKLSKEGKAKSDKNRLKVEEAFLKSTHAARAEAAAARREERRRVEKEKLLQDPEKQRKWEEKEQKRLAKKRAPRMKQLKVKAL